jgi:hypothetical protein
MPGGERFPVQACYRNQPDYEAKRILELHEFALLDRADPRSVEFVLVVEVNKQHKGAIERAIKSQNKGKIPEKVALLDFDAVIAPEFDWEEIFTLMTG